MTTGAARQLIVNADDFGLSAGVNRGIAHAHDHGIVTSASLMVRGPAAAGAATYARGRPRLSLGLHVDLGEWVYRGREWVAQYEVVPNDDGVAVAREAGRQVEQFRRLTGHDPTHLDSHQHVHRGEPVASVLADAASALAVPLRERSSHVRYCGAFYGQTGTGDSWPQGIGRDALEDLLRGLGLGITELSCHAGYGDDLLSIYRAERAQEVEVLCDARVRAVIDAQGIVLRSFHGVTWSGVTAMG